MDDIFTLSAVVIIFSAFIFKFIDSAFGGGYGTVLVPLFITFGYNPLHIIPALLLSEGISGIIAAFYHNKDHNVKFAKNSIDTKIAIILILFSLIGVIIFSFVNIKLPDNIRQLVISIIIIFVGLLILSTFKFKPHFSWYKVIGIGFFASSIKGITGGGYGPIIISGEIVSGINPKHAVGICMLAEGITCLIGSAIYFLTIGIDLKLSILLIIGSVLSSPFSALYVHKNKPKKIKFLIALVIICLGIYNLYNVIN